jgi:ABC-type molybdate transport system substrate-binding protein
MTSGAFTAAHLSLIPQLERLTKAKVMTASTSIGTGEMSIPNRLKRGEVVDIVIVAEHVLRQFIADGEVEIGLQQVSELLPVPGIAHITPLPPELQKVSTFAAGIAASCPNKSLARTVIEFLASPRAADAIKNSGLQTP